MIRLVSVIGVLGRETACQLLAARQQAREPTRNSEHVVDLKELGKEVAQGDPVDRDLLRRDCQNIDTVFWLPHINSWVLSSTGQKR